MKNKSSLVIYTESLKYFNEFDTNDLFSLLQLIFNLIEKIFILFPHKLVYPIIKNLLSLFEFNIFEKIFFGKSK
jgi:hypothetical protein